MGSLLNDTLLGIISERSTLNTMLAPNPPAIEKGKQNYLFKVGKTYTATGNGSLKKGIKVTIKERYKQNGFCYYVGDNNMVHRQKDLE